MTLEERTALDSDPSIISRGKVSSSVHPLRSTLAILLAATTWACQDRGTPPERPVIGVSRHADSSLSITASSPGRPAVEPKPEAFATARRALTTTGREPTDENCGPYRALSSAPAAYLEICNALADSLDATYETRFGVSIPHPPAGLVLVFGSAEGFRKFAGDFGQLRTGYAGFTMASRGVVATLTEGTPIDRYATVLGHELAHLVHRRIFGFNLAPWLSEGLADALGDTATASGFTELRGIQGVEPLAFRLQLAIETGRAESIGAVLAKTRASFDRGAVSYDYETSALVVRFLLLDSELAPRFRESLGRLASPERCPNDCILDTLGTNRDDLDRRFRRWLLEMTDLHPKSNGFLSGARAKTTACS